MLEFHAKTMNVLIILPSKLILDWVSIMMYQSTNPAIKVLHTKRRLSRGMCAPVTFSRLDGPVGAVHREAFVTVGMDDQRAEMDITGGWLDLHLKGKLIIFKRALP
mmetsp:Transcript_3162/g.3536  ORF Transcript_3162/g.3536 Transcript_3162/m.3536 type:complete len:106 (-) Transcript_3162:155-472(-)